MRAYFDNSATTKPCEAAREAAISAITECWGNPSSLHFAGTEAHNSLENARKSLASLIGCPKESFYFTPSGTTANNTAIFGAYNKLKKSGNRIVTTAIEHPSILMPLAAIEKLGVEVIRIKPDSNGNINEDEFLSAINDKTILVSCMAVNNEVGSLMPVASIRSAVKRTGAPALIHTDCIQGLAKVNVSPKISGADIITVSGHKIHALKGVGGIYLKDKNIVTPYILGGGQEKSVLSGTEAMPAILSFGAAADDVGDIKKNYEKVAALNKKFTESLKDIPCVTINSPADAIPYVLNVSIIGFPSQPIVNFMSEKGICISAGSACKLGHRSPVLTAMGLSPGVIDSAVRISFSRFNTEEETDYLIDAFREAANKYGKKG